MIFDSWREVLVCDSSEVEKLIRQIEKMKELENVYFTSSAATNPVCASMKIGNFKCH